MASWHISLTSPDGVDTDLEIDESVVNCIVIDENKYLKDQFSRLLFDVQAQRKRSKLKVVE